MAQTERKERHNQPSGIVHQELNKQIERADYVGTEPHYRENITDQI